MRPLARGVRALAAIALIAASARAQQFIGRVTFSDGAPATRVLLEATGPDGTVVAHALSDGAGRFVVTLPGAGRYALRALRIGFLPTEVPARAVAVGERVNVPLVLGVVPVRLDVVRVATDRVCRDEWAGDPAVAAVWEEARKALLTAQLTARQTDLAMSVRTHEALASRDGVIHEQTLTAYWREASTVRPFESVGDSVLLAEGYVVPQVTGTLYRAPDPDVLLAPSFARTHCMRLVPADSGRPDALGLAFQPNLARGQTDIAGVLWLDRETAALDELEFRYMNIAGVDPRVRQGGRVRFTRLGTGHWIVSGWELRMPRPLEDALTVIGGEVGEVRLGEEIIFTAGGSFDDILPTDVSVIAMACGEGALTGDWGMLRGEVIAPDGMPVSLASVRLEWSDGLGSRQLSVSTREDGTWHACAVPLRSEVDVEAVNGSTRATESVRLTPEKRLDELLLTLRPRR